MDNVIPAFLGSNKLINLLDFKSHSINIIETLNAMANIARYAGNAHSHDKNVDRAWSVLDHTILCDNISIILGYSDMSRKAVYIHDFHESVVTDITSPMIRFIRKVADSTIDPVRFIQGHIQETFNQAVGFQWPENLADRKLIEKQVRIVDGAAALIEMSVFWPKIMSENSLKLVSHLNKAVELQLENGNINSNFIKNMLKIDHIKNIGKNRFTEIFPSVDMKNNHDQEDERLWAHERSVMSDLAGMIMEGISEMDISPVSEIELM